MAPVVSNWGDIEIDKDDNVYFFNTSSSGSTYKYRIVKYSPAGAIIWQKNDIESEYSLSIDYYTTIKVLHSLDPGREPVVVARSGSAPDQQGIIKINPAGNEVWRQNVAAGAAAHGIRRAWKRIHRVHGSRHPG